MDHNTITDVVSAVGALAVAIITGFLIPLITKQAQVADQKVAQSVRDTLYPVLSSALNYAAQQIASGKPVINADSLAMASSEVQKQVAVAANYVEQHVPDALKYFDIQRGALERMLTSRLAGSTVEPTPAAAAPAVATAQGM